MNKIKQDAHALFLQRVVKPGRMPSVRINEETNQTQPRTVQWAHHLNVYSI